MRLFSSEYYLALSNETDTQIILDWEQAFATIEKDGTLQKIKDKWFPPPLPSEENGAEPELN